jgi:hypothetical protein
LAEWVSYPHHVVVVDIVAERELEPEGETAQFGEGPIARVIEARVVDVLWSERAPARPLPETLTWTAPGWALQDEGRTPLRFAGAPRVEVGQRFVVPLTTMRGDWSPLALESILEVDAQGKVVLQEDQNDPVAMRLAGRTPAELSAELRRTRPDPYAERRRDLEPYERAQYVQREKAAAASR